MLDYARRMLWLGWVPVFYSDHKQALVDCWNYWQRGLKTKLVSSPVPGKVLVLFEKREAD